MKEFTQTTVGLAGNCWQTAVACILEVDPAELPSQADIERCEFVDGEVRRTGASYNNALQRYLHKHHRLAYVELHLPTEALARLRVVGYHLMTGTTVRSEALGGMRHIVVGKDGETVWDPHPSRAGLIDDIQWALITPRPRGWSKWRDDAPCECPACRTQASD